MQKYEDDKSGQYLAVPVEMYDALHTLTGVATFYHDTACSLSGSSGKLLDIGIYSTCTCYLGPLLEKYFRSSRVCSFVKTDAELKAKLDLIRLELEETEGRLQDFETHSDKCTEQLNVYDYVLTSIVKYLNVEFKRNKILQLTAILDKIDTDFILRKEVSLLSQNDPYSEKKKWHPAPTDPHQLIAEMEEAFSAGHRIIFRGETERKSYILRGISYIPNHSGRIWSLSIADYDSEKALYRHDRWLQFNKFVELNPQIIWYPYLPPLPGEEPPKTEVVLNE